MKEVAFWAAVKHRGLEGLLQSCDVKFSRNH
jgi:hypothetical protein